MCRAGETDQRTSRGRRNVTFLSFCLCVVRNSAVLVAFRRVDCFEKLAMWFAHHSGRWLVATGHLFRARVTGRQQHRTAGWYIERKIEKRVRHHRTSALIFNVF